MDYWAPHERSIVQTGETARGETVRSYRQNTAFLLMWINPETPELNDVRDTAQEVFKIFNIKVIDVNYFFSLTTTISPYRRQLLFDS